MINCPYGKSSQEVEYQVFSTFHTASNKRWAGPWERVYSNIYLSASSKKVGGAWERVHDNITSVSSKKVGGEWERVHDNITSASSKKVGRAWEDFSSTFKGISGILLSAIIQIGL